LGFDRTVALGEHLPQATVLGSDASVGHRRIIRATP